MPAKRIGIIASLALVVTLGCDEKEHIVAFTSDMLERQASSPPAVLDDCAVAASEVANLLTADQARSLSAEGAEVIRRLNADDSLGGAIRARYGLNAGNQRLLASCSASQPADASLRIISLAQKLARDR